MKVTAPPKEMPKSCSPPGWVPSSTCGERYRLAYSRSTVVSAPAEAENVLPTARTSPVWEPAVTNVDGCTVPSDEDHFLTAARR